MESRRIGRPINPSEPSPARHMLNQITTKIATIALLVCCFPVAVMAQDNAGTQDHVRAQENEGIEQLLTQLSSDEFEVRERASAKLVQMGPAAIQSLKQPPIDLSIEASGRVTSIIKVLEERSLIRTSKLFLADSDATKSYGLPAWNAYREIVGGTRFAKILFLEFVRSQPAIANQIETIYQVRQSGKSSVLLESELSLLASVQANRLLDDFQRMTESGVGDSVGLMLAVAFINDKASMEVSELIRSSSQLGFSGYLNRPGFKPCLLELMSQWVPKSPDSMAMEVMGLSYFMNISTVLPIARRHISKSFDPFTREQAIICLSKFGKAEDVALLTKLADDATVIHKYLDLAGDDGSITESLALPPGLRPTGATEPSQVQKLVRVNDLAVAVSMVLAKENPKDIFPNYVAERFQSGWRSAVAVPESDQESRDQSIRAWTARHSNVESKPEPSLTPVPDPNP